MTAEKLRSDKLKNCRENCGSCPDLLKASLYQFKRVNKTFLLKNSINCECSNLIYVAVFQECKEEHIGETGYLVKININRQHIRPPQYQQLAVEDDVRTCEDGMFYMCLSFEINQENKSLRKSYEDCFID